MLDENSNWKVHDIYKITEGKNPIVTTIGTFDTESEENCENLYEMFNRFGTSGKRRHNLNGIYLNCATVIAFPEIFTKLDDLTNRHIDTFARGNFPTILALSEDLNFKLNLRQVDNFGWKSNATFDGLMGLFQRKEIEFGAIGILMRDERIEIVDWSAETFVIKACIMFRQPPLSSVSNIFVLPFAQDVWIGIVSLMFFIFTIIICQWILPHTIQMIHPFDSITFVFGAACQQGFYQSLNSVSGRIVIFFTFISSLFLFTSYSANIVALLQSPSNAIQSISDLTHSPLKMVVQETVYNHVFFDEAQDHVTKELYNSKIKPNIHSSFVTLNDGMVKIRSGLYAYQVEAHAAYQIISDTYDEHEKCGLKELEAFKLPMVTVPLKKHSAYKEIFTQRLRWQREVGLIKREFKKWVPQKSQCQNNMVGFVSVGIKECRTPFMLLGIGFVGSILIFILEIVIDKFLKWSKKGKEDKMLSLKQHVLRKKTKIEFLN